MVGIFILVVATVFADRLTLIRTWAEEHNHKWPLGSTQNWDQPGFKDLNRVKQEINNLLTSWEPTWARYVWLRGIGLYLFDTTEEAQLLLWKSIEMKQLQLVKDLVDFPFKELGGYIPKYKYMQHLVLKAYFDRYRLQHAQITPELQAELSKFDNLDDLAVILAPFLSDNPVRHARHRADFTLEGSPAVVKVKLLAYLHTQGVSGLLDKISFDAYPSITALQQLEQFCTQRGIPFSAWIESKQGPREAYALFKENADLNAYLARLMMSDKESNPFGGLRGSTFDFLRFAAESDYEWFVQALAELSPKDQTSFAWKYPRFSRLISLPDLKPSLLALIPPGQAFSFEKAEFILYVKAKYGSLDLDKIIDYYHDTAKVALILIDNPELPANPLQLKSMMPKDHTDEEKDDWWNYFINRKGEPIQNVGSDGYQVFGVPISFSVTEQFKNLSLKQ